MPQDVPLPEAQHSDEHEDDMAVSDEDVDFVQQHGQQLGFLANLNAAAIDRCAPQLHIERAGITPHHTCRSPCIYAMQRGPLHRHALEGDSLHDG